MSTRNLSGLQFSSEAAGDVHTWHTARDEGGNEVGRALVKHLPGNTYLQSLKVAPEHRRHGIGRQLLGAVIDAHGDNAITLEPKPFGDTPGPSERRLRAFYGSMGFTKNGKSLMVRRPS